MKAGARVRAGRSRLARAGGALAILYRGGAPAGRSWPVSRLAIGAELPAPLSADRATIGLALAGRIGYTGGELKRGNPMRIFDDIPRPEGAVLVRAPDAPAPIHSPFEVVGDPGAGRYAHLAAAPDGAGCRIRLFDGGALHAAVDAKAGTEGLARQWAAAWIEGRELPPAGAVFKRRFRFGDGPGWHHADGGWVQYGAEVGRDCVIGEGAEVGPDCRVVGKARVEAGATLTNGAVVSDHSVVRGGTINGGKVSGAAIVTGATIEGEVRDSAKVSGGAFVAAGASVSGNAEVTNAKILDKARVRDNARIGAWAVVRGDAVAGGKCFVHRHAVVGGKARIGGSAVLQGDGRGPHGRGFLVFEGRIKDGVHERR